VATGRNQKGMSGKNHHDNLSYSGHQQSYAPKPGRGGGNQSSQGGLFQPTQRTKPGGSPFKKSSTKTHNNKKPWWCL
jgi:hypothetical protein